MKHVWIWTDGVMRTSIHSIPLTSLCFPPPVDCVCEILDCRLISIGSCLILCPLPSAIFSVGGVHILIFAVSFPSQFMWWTAWRMALSGDFIVSQWGHSSNSPTILLVKWGGCTQQQQAWPGLSCTAAYAYTAAATYNGEDVNANKGPIAWVPPIT